MKQLLFTLGLVMFLTSFAFAQFKQGDVELQFSGNVGSLTTKSTYKSGPYSSDHSESQSFFYMTACPGYYVIDGLSLEPEIALLAVEKEQPAFYLLMNISYTYLVPQSKIAPFIRAGYGVSNSVRLPNIAGGLMHYTQDLDVKVLNLSGGLKFLVTKSASINAEVNYRSHNYSSSSGTGTFTSTSEHTWSSIGLLLGVSIII